MRLKKNWTSRAVTGVPSDQSYFLSLIVMTVSPSLYTGAYARLSWLSRPNSFPGGPPYHSSGRHMRSWKSCSFIGVTCGPLTIGKMSSAVLPATWCLIATTALAAPPPEDEHAVRTEVRIATTASAADQRDSFIGNRL